MTNLGSHTQAGQWTELWKQAYYIWKCCCDQSLITGLIHQVYIFFSFSSYEHILTFALSCWYNHLTLTRPSPRSRARCFESHIRCVRWWFYGSTSDYTVHTHTRTHHPWIASQFLPLRSESSTSPTVSREDIRDGDSEEERGSGEYYSGEEFPEDDIMLARDRYRKISRSDLDKDKFTIYRLWL